MIEEKNISRIATFGGTPEWRMRNGENRVTIYGDDLITSETEWAVAGSVFAILGPYATF